MNEKQLEQTHVDETIELIQIEQNMLDTKQQELTQEMNHSTKDGSIIYGTDESELILQPHFHFRY